MNVLLERIVRFLLEDRRLRCLVGLALGGDDGRSGGWGGRRIVGGLMLLGRGVWFFRSLGMLVVERWFVNSILTVWSENAPSVAWIYIPP